jgi:hypothetical protein
MLNSVLAHSRVSNLESRFAFLHMMKNTVIKIVAQAVALNSAELVALTSDQDRSVNAYSLILQYFMPLESKFPVLFFFTALLRLITAYVF